MTRSEAKASKAPLSSPARPSTCSFTFSTFAPLTLLARNQSASPRSVVVPAMTASRLPARSPAALDAGRRRHEQAPAVHEGRQAEVDLLLARERVRRRAALEVHAAARDGGDPALRRDAHPLDLDLRQPQALLERPDDLPAQVDRVPGRRPIGAHERKRHGGIPVADGDRPRVLDLLERARQVRGEGGARRQQDQQGEHQCGQSLHGSDGPPARAGHPAMRAWRCTAGGGSARPSRGRSRPRRRPEWRGRHSRA